MGSSFDYVCLPTDGLSGGIMVAWCRDLWSVSRQVTRRFSLMVSLDSMMSSAGQWSLVTVYRPVDQHLKVEFLDELRVACADSTGLTILCGDFNLIYQAVDRSNDHLNLRSMRRFRRAIDDMQVDELYLHGRLFTWSNEHRQPTFERIDRVFATVSWLERFPNHHLRALSSDCSDHAPILLQLNSEPWAKPRFRFEAFWVHQHGFEEVVREAWSCNTSNVDACRALDHKLRTMAKALKQWSAKNTDCVRS